MRKVREIDYERAACFRCSKESYMASDVLASFRTCQLLIGKLIVGGGPPGDRNGRHAERPRRLTRRRLVWDARMGWEIPLGSLRSATGDEKNNGQTESGDTVTPRSRRGDRLGIQRSRVNPGGERPILTRWRRIFRTSSGSVITARIRIGAEQLGQTNGSTS
jgi:hypothetical protein